MPIHASCDVALLKWGQPRWRKQLQEKFGVDPQQAPAEDFASGIVTFRNPETQQIVKAQFSSSWMYDNTGLKISVEGLGPGYGFDLNTLHSPLHIFIGDEASEAIVDSEVGLEKSTSSRGLMSIQTNEADLYGYAGENRDAARSFLKGHNGLLPFDYGLEITRLVMACYLSAERKSVIELTDPKIQKELENYIPAIQKGEGADFLYSRSTQ